MESLGQLMPFVLGLGFLYMINRRIGCCGGENYSAEEKKENNSCH